MTVSDARRSARARTALAIPKEVQKFLTRIRRRAPRQPKAATGD
jgi:hypothetical protein